VVHLNRLDFSGHVGRSAVFALVRNMTEIVSRATYKVTSMPGEMVPVSTRPTGTVPIPPIL
jgi:hypothetical protein